MLIEKEQHHPLPLADPTGTSELISPDIWKGELAYPFTKGKTRDSWSDQVDFFLDRSEVAQDACDQDTEDQDQKPLEPKGYQPESLQGVSLHFCNKFR